MRGRLGSSLAPRPTTRRTTPPTFLRRRRWGRNSGRNRVEEQGQVLPFAQREEQGQVLPLGEEQGQVLPFAQGRKRVQEKKQDKAQVLPFAKTNTSGYFGRSWHPHDQALTVVPVPARPVSTPEIIRLIRDTESPLSVAICVIVRPPWV